MNDRDLFEGILLNLKGAADLYLHGTIESGTENVHSEFNNLLNETLKLQNEVYNKMVGKGWYPIEQVEKEKITKVKQKFLAQ